MGKIQQSNRQLWRIKSKALAMFGTFLLMFPLYSVLSKPHQDTSPNSESLLTAPLSVEIDKRNLLTLQGDNIPTEEVLQAVALASGLDLHIEGAFSKNISFKIEALPVLEVLLQLLKDQNFVSQHLHTIKDEQKKEVLQQGQLWVYSFEQRHDLDSNQSGSQHFYYSDYQINQSATLRSQTPMLDEQPELPTDDELLAAYRLALADEDEFVRAEAVEAIAKINGTKATDLLAVALQDQAAWVREEAIAALVKIGEQTVLHTLSDTLNDEDSHVRDAALEAITDIGGDQAANALAPALQHDNLELRELAVDALIEIESETAIQLLHQASRDPAKSVREAAIEFLEDLTEEQ